MTWHSRWQVIPVLGAECTWQWTLFFMLSGGKSKIQVGDHRNSTLQTVLRGGRGSPTLWFNVHRLQWLPLCFVSYLRKRVLSKSLKLEITIVSVRVHIWIFVPVAIFVPSDFLQPIKIAWRTHELMRWERRWYHLIQGHKITFNNILYFLSSAASKPSLWPTQSPIQWVPGDLPPVVKWPGRETDHSAPTSAEVNKMWIYASIPPYTFMA
jgi:hypothetical protein